MPADSHKRSRGPPGAAERSVTSARSSSAASLRQRCYLCELGSGRRLGSGHVAGPNGAGTRGTMLPSGTEVPALEMEAARGPRAVAAGGVGQPVLCSALLQPGSDLHQLICHAGTPRAGAPAGRGASEDLQLGRARQFRLDSVWAGR